MSITIEQVKVDELVDRFYEKLLKEPYYISMFTERNVDIELLKSRQRTFINRLVTEEQESQVSQVKQRHSFHIAPESARIWMRTMRETVEEIEWDETIKSKLIEKIELLLKKMMG